jgi:hypothetical protein
VNLPDSDALIVLCNEGVSVAASAHVHEGAIIQTTKFADCLAEKMLPLTKT